MSDRKDNNDERSPSFLALPLPSIPAIFATFALPTLYLPLYVYVYAYVCISLYVLYIKCLNSSQQRKLVSVKNVPGLKPRRTKMCQTTFVQIYTLASCEMARKEASNTAPSGSCYCTHHSTLHTHNTSIYRHTHSLSIPAPPILRS